MPDSSKRPARAERIVILVGAGASVPAGYPVTTQLLERIWKGLHDDDPKKGWRSWAGMRVHQSGRAKRKKLLKLFAELYPGLGSAQRIDGASIVDVLSFTDMLLAEGRAVHSNSTHADLREQRALLEIAMHGVLHGRKKRSLSEHLGNWILGLAGRTNTSRIAIVTTNYDTLLEDALYKALRGHGVRIGAVVDFGIPWRPVPAAPPVIQRPQHAPLACLKLHGSLNWLRCENCGFVTITPGMRIHSLEFWTVRSPVRYNECDCGGLLRGTLVVPSTVRTVRDANLLAIWQAALEEIRHADRLIILGYSLPAEDVTVRSLLMRALNGRPPRTNAPARKTSRARAKSNMGNRDKPLNVEVVQFERADTAAPAFPRFRMVFPEHQLPAEQFHVCGVEAWAETRISPPTARGLAAAMRRIKARGRAGARELGRWSLNWGRV